MSYDSVFFFCFIYFLFFKYILRFLLLLFRNTAGDIQRLKKTKNKKLSVLAVRAELRHKYGKVFLLPLSCFL